MTATLQDSNAELRKAVEARLATGSYDEFVVLEDGPATTVTQPAAEESAQPRRFYGGTVHPVSQEFFDLCDQLKEMHRRKSSDYGCPSGTDPLANIRNGAKFVGIEPWRAAMVRLSDKVTRLASYCATGRLENETLEDSLADLASYSLLALLLHREERAH
jgi:hypothetical protein